MASTLEDRIKEMRAVLKAERWKDQLHRPEIRKTADALRRELEAAEALQTALGREAP